MGRSVRGAALLSPRRRRMMLASVRDETLDWPRLHSGRGSFF
jgi:hypothetical protein